MTVKAQLFPGLAYFAIIVQIAAMILCIFEDLLVFATAMFFIIMPMVVYVIQKKRGKIRTEFTLGADEVKFDEKFPGKTK